MKNMRQLINAVMVTEGTWALPTADDQVADANRMGQMELPLDEDSVDDDKTDQLNNLFMSVDALKQEVEELARLDTQEGASGVGDLHDQITTMYNLLDKFDDVIDRSTNIVPTGLRQGKY
jgi:hypothetical protein